MTERGPQYVDISHADAVALLGRADSGTMTPDDLPHLVAMARGFFIVLGMIRQAQATIARLRRFLGIANSEKTSDVCPPKDEPPQGVSDAAGTPGDDGVNKDAEDDDDDEVAPKGHGRVPAGAYEDAKRVAVPHEKLRAGDGCPCCARGKLFDLGAPSRIVRIFGTAPLVAVEWSCDRLRCSGCGEVFTAKAPEAAQGPKYDDTAASMMALMRYGTGMPLCRLAHMQANLRTPVPASTQWEVVRDRALELRPVYDELARRAAAGRVVHNDDTYVRILALMGKRRAELVLAGELPTPERTGLFTTGVVAVTAEGPIALFRTGRKHAGENLTDLLALRDTGLGPPIQMCDGLDRNLPKGHDVLLGNCLAHGRRYFVDELNSFPDECRHVLEQLRLVFKAEVKCKKKKLTPEERLALHQRESEPVMAGLHAWMNAALDDKRVEPNSGLGKAFEYLLARWGPITLFLRVAGAPLENNICERALKMAIRHRNNSLFYRSEHGAAVGDLYMSLIHTAQLHGVNAFEYLTVLLRNARDLAAEPAAWLPWSFRGKLAVRRAA